MMCFQIQRRLRLIFVMTELIILVSLLYPALLEIANILPLIKVVPVICILVITGAVIVVIRMWHDKKWLIWMLFLVCLFFFSLLFLSGLDTGKQIVGLYAGFVLVGFCLVFMSHRNIWRSRVNLLAICCYTGLLQLLSFMFIQLTPEEDMSFYYENALMLLNGGNEIDLYHAVFPHTLTYPAFLSIFMYIFGESIDVAFIINHLAVITSALLVYGIAEKGLPKPAAMVAGLLFALSPLNIMYPQQVQAELLYGVLILAAIFVYLRAGTKRTFPAMITVGILIGFANFFRPTALILVIALLLHLVLFRCRSIKKTCAGGGLLLLAYLLIIMGTQAGISALLHENYPSSSYGWNLYVGASDTGSWNYEDSREFSKKMAELDDPTDIHEYFAKKGIQRYMDMGTGVLSHFKDKSAVLFSGLYSGSLSERTPDGSILYDIDMGSVSAVFRIVHTLITAGGLLGLILISIGSLKSRGERPLQTAVIFYIGYALLLLIMESAPRYIVSLIPIYCIGAAALLHQLSLFTRDIITNFSHYTNPLIKLR